MYIKQKEVMTTPVLTVNDLCDYLKVHPSTIYRLIKAGELPAFRIGSDWRFNVEEIEQWLTECEKRPNATDSPLLVHARSN
jgi:excisionase family DNA binding protein